MSTAQQEATPTGDQLRAIARQAENMSGPSDSTGPTQYVLAGWRAALSQQAAQKPSDEYKGWYCAHCQRGVDASEVTFHEQHQECGRFIANDRPPVLAQHPIAYMWQHGRTGHIGFVETLDDADMKTWKQINPSLKIVSPLYAAALSTPPADNAPWLTKAHALCADMGVPPGALDWRLDVLRGLLEEGASLVAPQPQKEKP